MKHMNSRRILAMLLALCMMACLLSMTAFAADPLPEDADPDEWDTIVLTKEDGTKLVAGTDYTVTRGTYSHYAYTEPFKYNIYNVTTTDAIVISGGASYSNSSLSNPLKSRISLGAAVTRVTLQNVTALGELSIADGSSVTFTLKNENNIDYIYGKGETTNMTFEGDGSLTGKHIGGVNKYGAAKGTNIGCNITINSGTFNITAGYEAAIGGGQYGDSGKIVINGGNITAKSNYGAAIGGGQNGDAAAIEVSDGEINATGSFGAAIGGGQSGDAKEIGIEGGVINARGSHVGAAIGGGQNGNVGKIEITDGDITVVARNMAIGGETADDISISGGNIKLGKLDSSSKEVTPDASQIGSKSSSETSAVTITGGTFKSTDDVVVNVSAYVPEDCTYNPETGEVTGAPSYVAYIGTQGYTALEEAFAALDETNHTLMLTENGKTKWDSAKPVYWAVGEGNYTAAATLAAALKAAYMNNSTGEKITVVCRPNASVGKMSHAHVTDNLVIYGNSAYVEIGGDQDIEVDTYAYSRSTGAQVADNVATSDDYLDKDITINLYEIDNLSVWGQRHTVHTVTINMTDCETNLGEAAKGLHRIYISGITGVNNISLKNCKFASVPTAIYTNANGSVSVDSCEFNNAALAVNLNHKAADTQNVDIKNCTFTGCGDAGEWKAFAAPVRLVQSVEGGTQTATVDSCSFSETAGNNGDILLGDGRTGEESHDVSLTVKNTAAKVMAQKPNYYDANGSVADETLGKTQDVAKSEEVPTSVETLLPPAAEGVAKITHSDGTEDTYATLAEAFAAAADGDTVKLIANVDLPTTVIVESKTVTLDLNGHKLFNTKDIWNDTDGVKHWSLISVRGTSNLTIVDSTNSTESGLFAKENDVYALDVYDVTSKVTIKAGNFVGNCCAIYAVEGFVTIEGGHYSVQQKHSDTQPDEFVLNCYDANYKAGKAKITVKGGSFEGYDPFNNDSEGAGTKVTDDGVGITKTVDESGNVTYAAATGMVAQIMGTDGKSKAAYKSLNEAMEKVEKGQTVMLLANATANITIPAGKDFTLDLNGKTLNGGKNNANATIKNYGTVVIDDSSKEKAGRIIREDVGNETGTTYYVIHNLGTMTIKNGTIYNNSGYEKANPSGSMEGSSLICNSDDDAHPATLNIEGGTLVQENFIAIKNGSSGTLVMTGGTVKSGHSAIQNWHDATITGGKVIGQLWTDSYIDEFSTGKTVFGGEAEFEGEIVMDITGNIKPTLEIKGGELDVTSWRVTNAAANAGARPEVSGGTFTSEVPANYCKDGFVPATLPGGKYGVEPAEGDVKLIGVDGNVRYGNIADAADGETIQLYKDITVDGVYLRTGRTLDLNGWTLTTEYVYAPGADVIDSKDGVGKLVVTNKDNVTVKMSASYLPLYDGTGYRIFKYTFTFLAPELDSTKSKITLRMILAFENLDAYNVLTASSQHGIDMGFRVAWPNDNNSDQSWQLRMTPEGVTDVYTKAKTKVGLEGCKTGKVKLVITGVNLLSSDVLYSLSELVSANWTNGMTIVSDKATTTIK